MGHCSGGDGAHAIGNQLAEVSEMTPEDNVLVRMVEWVEGGDAKAPEFVRGTKYINVSSPPPSLFLIYIYILEDIRRRKGNETKIRY
jgi:hypothetical protein